MYTVTSNEVRIEKEGQEYCVYLSHHEWAIAKALVEIGDLRKFPAKQIPAIWNFRKLTNRGLKTAWWAIEASMEVTYYR